MKRLERFAILLVLAGITLLFFFRTVIFGLVPHPSDVLVSDFQPWRSTSYLGFAAGGIPNKAQYPDTIRQMYPWKTVAVEAMKRGRLPLWNPYNFSGSPLLANFQSAALYPLGLLYMLLPQIDAWTMLIVLQPLLALLFTYLYGRKIGLRPLPSWLAAFSYGLSGFMSVWLEYNTVGHVILWLPLILLAVEHQREKPVPLWLGILAFGNASALLAGHPQVYAYTLAFSLAYAWFRAKAAARLYVFAFSALGIGAAGLQLVPGMELIANAARSPHEFDTLFSKILIQPWQLLALPLPNIFGNPATRTYFPSDTFVGKVTTIGLVPLFFVLSALRRKDGLTKFFLGGVVAVLVLITANPVTYFLYRIPIPLITSSSPTLSSFLLAFSLAMLCGLGLQYWITDTHSVRKLIRRTIEVAVVLGGIIVVTRVPAFPEITAHAPVIAKAVLYGGAVSAATLFLFWVFIRFPRLRTYAVVLMLVVHVLDLFVFFQRFNPFVPKALVFPDHPILSYLRDKGPERYWGYATAGISANFASQYHAFSPEGYDPLYPRWYGQFLYSYRTGSKLTAFDNATRSDAAISSSFGDGGLSDTKKRAVLNALSVRYVLDRNENASDESTFPPDTFKKAYTYNDWTVYENTEAKPRAYLTQGTARITSYQPERVVIETQSSISGTLVLTDTYYPGWIADVDGTRTAIAKTDEGLRRIEVSAGAHTVTMSYAPKSVVIGFALSLLSAGATIIGIALVSRKRT